MCLCLNFGVFVGGYYDLYASKGDMTRDPRVSTKTKGGVPSKIDVFVFSLLRWWQ
jgi:hypothetical protein